jgi:hypothetical protein
MPKRFGIVGPDGLIDYPTSPKQIAPAAYRVDLALVARGSRPCRADDVVTWQAPGAREVRRTGLCRFSAYFPKEGEYALRATLRGADGATGSAQAKVLVQDWLIFGLGDSNGSGEGTPDIPSPPLPAVDPPVWHSLQCDRSANSFEAQAARSLENQDEKTSVTFVHLACSGASIASGMLGPYDGINPGPTLPPQVEEMRRLAGGREIDAVLVSIGVNDLGFGAMVKHCILLPACQNRGFPDVHDLSTLGQVMSRRIAALPGLYDRLSHELKAVGVPARNVFISEYFDSTRDSTGAFCNPLIRIDAIVLRPYAGVVRDPLLGTLVAGATSVQLDFDQSEAQWAYESVLRPLNRQVRAAASKHGWRLIGGVERGFRDHGYCSDRGPTDPWIVGMTESFERQHDHNGTLHANTRGNAFTASLAAKLLRRELYPGGVARRPA